jgi:succinyl-CoA synthetase beta subunit
MRLFLSWPRVVWLPVAQPRALGCAKPVGNGQSQWATQRGSTSLEPVVRPAAGLSAGRRSPSRLTARRVDLYEYQGKELFRRFGIPTSEGRLAATPDEARAAAEAIGGQVVVKAQVLTGGRGKAGGVKLAEDAGDAEQKANDILGLEINGHVVDKLWIERASEIAKEYYLSITFDRGEKRPLFMLTTEGGVEIEQVAEETPQKLARLHIDPLEGFHPYQARRLIYGAEINDPGEQKQVLTIIGRLYDCFVSTDAMLCEVNPLIVTPEGEVRALDSKFTVDDNALFKHPEIAEMRDLESGPPEERAAREKGVTYVKLDGEVGILGNGAGLVMSTLDVIALAGGRPANFCDLGGGGDAQGVVDALEVITADPQVRSIFFNIFGGITRGDEVARGILQALGQIEIEHPIVVRLDGTNAEEGRKILGDADAESLYVEPTMLEAAKRAVELAQVAA